MAYIGMRKPIFAPISGERTDGSAITYGTPMVIGPAVSANLSFSTSDNPDYGDDVEVDNDTGINGYSIAMETNDITPEGRAKVMGWKPVTGTGSSVTEYDVTDEAPPEGGLGYIRVKLFRGARKYEAFFYHCLQCQSGGENASTKQRQITWNHPTINATGKGVFIDNSGKAKYFKYMEFETEAAALAWIYSKFGAQVPT